jgi:UDP-GlcNAc:undecaprenyl-phosphate/decaprenyl-phosphate GlcNAc-1-phosphate transferase
VQLLPRLVAAGAGAAAARVAYGALRARHPGGAATWDRLNHRGETVTLLEGPAFTAGAAAAVAVVPGLPRPVRAAGVIAALGAGVVGVYDDLAGDGKAGGFAGHLEALRRGEITTGAVKIVGVGATGLASAALLARSLPARSLPARSLPARPLPARWLPDALLGGALVAGFANLVNLLDLRPGRALKFGLLHAPLVLDASPAGVLAAAPLGAAAALLPEDLGERAMLGDAGANALGALLGTAVLLRYGRRGRLAHLLAIGALTAASEKVSFTKVIEATAALRWVDELGRRPRLAG